MDIVKIEVRAEWDPEAKVWVATSDDVVGLVTEAETIESLQKKLSILIPELLDANGSLEHYAKHEIPMNLIAHREELISLRG